MTHQLSGTPDDAATPAAELNGAHAADVVKPGTTVLIPAEVIHTYPDGQLLVRVNDTTLDHGRTLLVRRVYPFER